MKKSRSDTESVKVFKSIGELNDTFGIPTQHPLMHICEMETMGNITIEGNYCFNFYAIFLTDDDSGAIKYGRNYYSYQSGTMLFMAPGQVIEEEIRNEPNHGWIVLFHQDLLRGTPLGHNISSYTFFQYAVNEALHMTDEERGIIVGCCRNLKAELSHAADGQSETLIVSNLELLLNYSKRFYERQFATSSQVNSDILTRFERILDDYLQSGELVRRGIPNVKYIAESMNLSPNYLSDMLRKHTGKNASEHIQEKLIDMAKDMLLYHTDKNINEIAYQLGFEYPQYFCRLFKKRVGMTPNEYRAGK